MYTFKVLAALSLALLFSGSGRAQVFSISDFNALNPINPNHLGGGGSWIFDGEGNQVSQVRSFTDGAITGQQVAPFQGGNPNSDGVAISFPFAGPLNLSGKTALALTARLLPGHTAASIAVVLYTDAGTLEFGSGLLFPASDFSTLEFRTVTMPFSEAFVSWRGLADLASISQFAIGGDGVPRDESYQVQFAGLTAIPEPSTLASSLTLLAFGAGAFLVRKRKTQRL